MFVPVKNIGSIGVIKDLSVHELPIQAFTDCKNIRFLDGYASQFFGHGEVYNSPTYIPQHVAPVIIAGARYFIYATASKLFAVTNTGGASVHTDISHVTPRTGVVNSWTSTTLSGVPVFNAGDGKAPMSWDLNLANKFIDLANWLPSMSCKSLRAYKVFLIALNVSRSPRQTISTITRVGTTATLTTASAHGLSTGNTVYITQATPSQYNGTYTITVTGGTTFTYVMASDPGASATGGILFAGTAVENSRLVKWSHPADPGAVPTSWDEADPTKDAGEVELSDGGDPIIDGLQLRNSFMIYKEKSIYRMDYIGGSSVFRFEQVIGTSGALNKNCIVEIDGNHLVLTGSDVIIHDGQNPTSVLDKQTRRFLFLNIDVTNIGMCFVFKNPYFNEAFICYPSIGATSCDSAMVWNYKDRTVSFRDMPNINHANFGAVDNGLQGNWNQDPAPWSSDLTLWDGGDFVPSTQRVIMAANDLKLYLLDASSSFDGSLPSAYLERIGLSFDDPESIKMIKGIRPRITGNVGDTVTISVGWSNDPYATPTYSAVMTHTIGSTIQNDCFVSGRYLSYKISTGTAYQWRLDSLEFEIENMGAW